jgi:hypothetical protein
MSPLNRKGGGMRSVMCVLAACFVVILGAGMAAACAQEQFSIWASEDAWVNEQNPTAAYGNNTYLSVKDRSGVAESWIKFGAQEVEKLKNVQIGDASLRLYQYMGTYSPGDEISLRLGDTNWSEQSISWEGKPGYSANVISSVSVADGEGVWREWTGLGGLLKTWNGGDLCFVLENHADSKNEEFFGRFYSSEYGDAGLRPNLKVTVTPEPVSALLFLSGAGTLALARRRRMRR